MHENFNITSFILGTSEESEELFFDNLDIKKERGYICEPYQVPATTSNMLLPEYRQAMYNYPPCGGAGSELASPVSLPSPASLPSPMMELSPAHSPAHMVPTNDFNRRGLRYTLHSKRAPQGFVAMENLDKRRRRDDELSPDELQKRQLRRERNKEAALRCRTRRRERIEALEKETAELEEMNGCAEKEISGLKVQLEQLQQMLAEHDCSLEANNFALDQSNVKKEPEF